LSRAHDGLLAELLAESLAVWHVSGTVTQADGDGIVIQSNTKKIRIEPAARKNMFRWMVTVDGRQRPAISLVAVLRQVRQALDPGYAMSRVRVTVAPLMPPS
jgi:hypothetical protein